MIKKSIAMTQRLDNGESVDNLPVGIYGSCCAILPFGDLMVGAFRENVDRKH